MGHQPAPRSQPEPCPGDPVAAIYRRALPQVYGYLLPRCGSAALAEDLTAETFMAAVAATRRRGAAEPTVAWLIGVARHKLIDHWRRDTRERRRLAEAGRAGARFRAGPAAGVGVRQAVLEDPSGNLVELFEPVTGHHERAPGQRPGPPAPRGGRP